jgi:hypothetical protein
MYSIIICDNVKLHGDLIEIINQAITVWAYVIDEEVISYDLLRLCNISESKRQEAADKRTSEQHSVLCFTI